MNKAACKCGTSACVANSTCASETNTCAVVKDCTSVDGIEKSTGVCKCGSVGCVTDD